MTVGQHSGRRRRRRKGNSILPELLFVSVTADPAWTLWFEEFVVRYYMEKR